MPNTVVGPRAIVTKYSRGLDVSWVLMEVDGHVRFAVYQEGAADIGRQYDSVDPVVTPGVWQHIAGSFDPATQAVKVYVNGVPIAIVASLGQQQGQVTSIRDSNSPVRIGALQDGTGAVAYFWNGLVDDVDVFDRALSDEEVTAIASAGSAGKCDGEPPPPECGASDLTANVQVTQGTFVPVPPLFNLYSQRVVITNSGPESLTGPLYLVTDGLPRRDPVVCPFGCGLAVAQPMTHCDSPNGSYLIPLPVTTLAPRQSVTVTLVLTPGPTTAGSAQDKFHYSIRVLRGTPQL